MIPDIKSLSNEQILDIVNILKDYAFKNNIDIIELISSRNNIPIISKKLYKELPFKYKMFFSEEKIKNLINENYDELKEILIKNLV